MEIGRTDYIISTQFVCGGGGVNLFSTFYWYFVKIDSPWKCQPYHLIMTSDTIWKFFPFYALLLGLTVRGKEKLRLLPFYTLHPPSLYMNMIKLWDCNWDSLKILKRHSTKNKWNKPFYPQHCHKGSSKKIKKFFS